MRNAGLGLGAIPLIQQNRLMQFLQQTPYKMRILRNDVGIFTEKGGTIAYYISKKNIAIVDAEFPEQSRHLIDVMQKYTLNYAWDVQLLFKRRITNLYLTATSLKSYVELNYSGFRKILKK